MTSLEIKKSYFLFLCWNTVTAQQDLSYKDNKIRPLLVFHLVMWNWEQITTVWGWLAVCNKLLEKKKFFPLPFSGFMKKKRYWMMRNPTYFFKVSCWHNDNIYILSIEIQFHFSYASIYLYMLVREHWLLVRFQSASSAFAHLCHFFGNVYIKVMKLYWKGKFFFHMWNLYLCLAQNHQCDLSHIPALLQWKSLSNTFCKTTHIPNPTSFHFTLFKYANIHRGAHSLVSAWVTQSPKINISQIRLCGEYNCNPIMFSTSTIHVNENTYFSNTLIPNIS